MDKSEIVALVTEAIQKEFETLRSTSQQTRAAGNDAESRAEGKYDTRSTEDNYLADGLARQALAAATAGSAYEKFTARPFAPDAAIDIGALVEVAFENEAQWFFLGPAGGGVEVSWGGASVIVLTPESPLARQLIGLKAGDATKAPAAKVRTVQ